MESETKDTFINLEDPSSYYNINIIFFAIFVAIIAILIYNNIYLTGSSTDDIYGATIKRKQWFKGTVNQYTAYQFIHQDNGQIVINIKPQVGKLSTINGKYLVSESNTKMDISLDPNLKNDSNANVVYQLPWVLTYIDQDTLRLDYNNQTYAMLNLGQPLSS